MNPQTTAAYRAWRTAAEKGYGSTGHCDPVRMTKTDAKIRRLKAKYEALLADSMSQQESK